MKKTISFSITLVILFSTVASVLLSPTRVNAKLLTNRIPGSRVVHTGDHLQQEITATMSQVAPSDTPTQTVEPPGSYERPIIVVEGYSLDQDTISPGSSFIIFINLYNAGQQYAKNIVAAFSSGDLIPRQTGGLVAVGEIAPGNHAQFSQPLFLDSSFWGTVVSINMTITYTNETGAAYSDTFTITLPVYLVYSPGSTATPTPTQTTVPNLKPQLVIGSYKTDITPLQPGTEFNLTINIQNMGKSVAKNVTMVVGGGSSSTAGEGGTAQPGGISGGSGEFTNFAPIGSSNVQSLGDFAPTDSKTAYQPLIVNVSTAPGAYPLKISFIYINEQNQTFVDDQVITLLVNKIPILDISFYQQVSTFYTGQPNVLPIQVVNMGRSSVVLGNMSVAANSGQFTNSTIFVGNLDPGGYFTLDANYIPDTSGMTDLVVSVNYTNDFNQPLIITQTLTVQVEDQPVIEPPSDGSQNGGSEIIVPQPESFLHKIWRFILGLLGLDSGVTTDQIPMNGSSSETPAPEQPVVIPGKPLKGP